MDSLWQLKCMLLDGVLTSLVRICYYCTLLMFFQRKHDSSSSSEDSDADRSKYLTPVSSAPGTPVGDSSIVEKKHKKKHKKAKDAEGVSTEVEGKVEKKVEVVAWNVWWRFNFRSTLLSRPKKSGSQMSVHTYVRPQKVSLITMKFCM